MQCSLEINQPLTNSVVGLLTAIADGTKSLAYNSDSNDAAFVTQDDIRRTDLISNLQSLATLIYDKGSSIPSVHHLFLKTISDLLLSPQTDPYIKRLGLLALGNLIVSTGARFAPLHEQVLVIIKGTIPSHVLSSSNAFSNTNNDDLILVLVVLSGTFSCLYLLLNENRSIAKNSIQSLFPFFTSVCFSPIFSNRIISLSNEDDCVSVISLLTTLSISDRSAFQQTDILRKTHVNALLCLDSMIRSSPKDIYQYWYLLLPNKNVDPNSISIVDLIGSDNKKISLASSKCVISMLNGSKQYLSAAKLNESGKNQTHFLPLPTKTLASVISMNYSILEMLNLNLDSLEIINNLLVALAEVINNTPYVKVNEDIRSNLFAILLKYLGNSSTVTSNLVWECISSLLVTGYNPKLIFKNTIPELNLTVYEYIINSLDGSANISVLNIFDNLAKLFPIYFLSIFWINVNPSLAKLIQDVDVEESIKTISFNIVSTFILNLNASNCDFTNTEVEETTIFKNTCIDDEFWMSIVSTYIDPYLKSKSTTLISVYDLIGSIPENGFKSLSDDKQLLLFNELVDYNTRMNKTNVIYASIKAIGNLSLFVGSKIEFCNLLSNSLSKIVDFCKNEKLNVANLNRILLALANILCSISESIKLESNFIFNFDMIRTAMSTIYDIGFSNDKLKGNSIRGFNFIFKIISYCETGFTIDDIKFINYKILPSLILCLDSKMAKIQWNSFISISTAFDISILDSGKQIWVLSLFKSLNKLLRNSKNIKVRSSAVKVLLNIKTLRQIYIAKDLIPDTITTLDFVKADVNVTNNTNNDLQAIILDAKRKLVSLE